LPVVHQDPEKGLATFYAEAKEPISTIGREDNG
jgi:hypothetical protein